jgi:hypothetical protein
VIRSKAQDSLHRKVQLLRAGADSTPRIARIYLTELSELPSACGNYPVQAQHAFMATFNANLARYGSQEYAMKAGFTAMRGVAERIKANGIKGPAFLAPTMAGRGNVCLSST